MRILISLSYYSPNISGLTIYAKTLAQELVKKGHEITVLTSQYEKDLPREEIVDGIRIVRIPVTLRIGKGPLMFSLPIQAFKWIVWAEVVNCHLPQLESFILALLARINHKKLILTYQTDLSWDGGLLLKISKIFLLISHFISAIFANKIIALSKDYAEHSGFLKLFSKKLSYIFPPVKLESIDKSSSNSFGKDIRMQKKYLIGIVARIAPEKGIEYLLRAIPYLVSKLNNDFVIVLAGPPKPIGEDRYIRKIESLSKKYNKFVKLLGRLSDEDLARFYKSLDVLVLPSINSTEAFGMVQIEAMLSGAPVVASNLPGVRVPIIETGMGEISKPRNSNDLAEKISKVLLNRKKYTTNVKKANILFSKRHAIEAYEKILN